MASTFLKTLGLLGLLAATAAVLSLVASWTAYGWGGFLDTFLEGYRRLFHDIMIERFLGALKPLIDIQLTPNERDKLILYSIGFGAQARATAFHKGVFMPQTALERLYYVVLHLAWPVMACMGVVSLLYVGMIKYLEMDSHIKPDDGDIVLKTQTILFPYFADILKHVISVLAACIVAILINEAYGLI